MIKLFLQFVEIHLSTRAHKSTMKESQESLFSEATNSKSSSSNTFHRKKKRSVNSHASISPIKLNVAVKSKLQLPRRKLLSERSVNENNRRRITEWNEPAHHLENETGEVDGNTHSLAVDRGFFIRRTIGWSTLIEWRQSVAIGGCGRRACSHRSAVNQRRINTENGRSGWQSRHPVSPVFIVRVSTHPRGPARRTLLHVHDAQYRPVARKLFHQLSWNTRLETSFPLVGFPRKRNATNQPDRANLVRFANRSVVLANFILLVYFLYYIFYFPVIVVIRLNTLMRIIVYEFGLQLDALDWG